MSSATPAPLLTQTSVVRSRKSKSKPAKMNITFRRSDDEDKVNEFAQEAYVNLFTHDLMKYCRERAAGASAAPQGNGDTVLAPGGKTKSRVDRRKKMVIDKIRDHMESTDDTKQTAATGDQLGKHIDDFTDIEAAFEDYQEDFFSTFRVRTPPGSTESELAFDMGVMSRAVPAPLIRSKSYPFIEREVDAWAISWTMGEDNNDDDDSSCSSDEDEDDESNSSSSGSTTSSSTGSDISSHSMGVLERFMDPVFELGEKGSEKRCQVLELCRTNSLPDLRLLDVPPILEDYFDELETDSKNNSGQGDGVDRLCDAVEQITFSSGTTSVSGFAVNV